MSPNEVCQWLHQTFNSLPRFAYPFEPSDVPGNGIYILFDHGETAHGADRIVRVGTHTGHDQLPSRLEEHFLRANKDRSIFIKNIGRSILNRDGNPLLAKWEIKTLSKQAKATHLSESEKNCIDLVEDWATDRICSTFSFVAFRMDDRKRRLALESKIVSIISRCTDCRPSKRWLGQFSTKHKIRESGLWQERGVYKDYPTAGVIDEIERCLTNTT